MSLSPTASASNGSESAPKRRRTNGADTNGSPAIPGGPPDPGRIPKRGARACTACRKGKNRCEGDAPCRRCQLSGTPCVFEKPEKKNVSPAVAGVNAERLSRLEGQYLVMQSHMIGMQSSLDRILSVVQGQANAGSMFPPPPPPHQAVGNRPFEEDRGDKFPPLPGFAPPPHKYATYGIIPSTAASSEDESEDTLPRATLNAPIEALQGLANAAAEAAAVPSSASAPRVKKRKRAEPIPRNAFPHVVEKGLVTDSEARELYNM